MQTEQKLDFPRLLGTGGCVETYIGRKALEGMPCGGNSSYPRGCVETSLPKMYPMHGYVEIRPILEAVLKPTVGMAMD